MTLGFLSGSKNFCKLLWVSCEVLFLHGYAWIHWVARSCTTTAYRWLFRDSQLSLRTLWSAVIKSPKSFFAFSSWRVESSWSWVGESDLSDFPRRVSCSSPRSRLPGWGGCSQTLVTKRFLMFRPLQGIWSVHFYAASKLPLHWPFGRGYLMRPSPPILHCLRP